MRITFCLQRSKTQSFDITVISTLAAVFLITVVHAVKHVITAPAPRDTVSTIQTQKLIFSALLHTANLSPNTHGKSSKLVMWSDVVSCNQRKPKHLMIHALTWVDA